MVGLIPVAMKNWSRRQADGALIWQQPVGWDAGLTTTTVCPPAEAEQFEQVVPGADQRPLALDLPQTP